jgi:hypothetical protein
MLPLCGNLEKRKSPFFLFQRTATAVELSWTSKLEQIYNLL